MFLSLASIITPFNIINYKFFFSKDINFKKKIFLKQSYIFLTWFYYFSFFKNNEKKKIKLVFLPQKKMKYTLMKGPMAHKTRDKEQFIFRTYNFKFSINFILNNQIESLNNISNMLHFVLLTKNNFPKFETNIFFIKNFKINVSFSENFFFSYYKNKFII